MAATPVVVTTTPLYLNNNDEIYTAHDLRRPWADMVSPGVSDYNAFRVKQRIAGANMSVDVGLASSINVAWVRGSSVNDQGIYRVEYEGAQLNANVATNVSANPRLDQVIVRVEDAQHAGSNNRATVDVVLGTATSGATLDNRNGAAVLPATCILIADILVPGSESTSIDTADIRDRRPFGVPGTIPPLLTDIDIVALEPVHAVPEASIAAVHGSHDNSQLAYAVKLPRRIVSATRIRWKYAHGATPCAGNYVIAIYDASGRLVVSTGSVAFTGAGNSYQVRSETITATTFEAGTYYVLFGLDTTAQAVAFAGISAQTSNGSRALPGIPNVLLGVGGGGGVTPPTTLLSLSDMSGVTSALDVTTPAPLVALSVG